MSTAKIVLCVLCCFILIAGCKTAPKPAPEWPELNTEDPPDANVQPPPWYKPAKEYSPWPLGPEPKYSTEEWRHWCALRYNSRDVVQWLEAPPTIDGKLDDAAWKNATVKSDFIDTTGKRASPTTIIYIAYDKDNLYVAARAEELYPTKLLAAAKHESERVLLDDHIEIDLAPDWKAESFRKYQIFVNSKGVTAEAVNADISWNPGLMVSAVVGEKSWTVELAIPLKSLGVKADELWGRVWACRFIRHRYAGGKDEVSSWTRMLNLKTGAGNWGHVIFRDVKPPKKKPPKPPKKKPPKPPTKKGTDN